jgi:DNA modification methylase
MGGGPTHPERADAGSVDVAARRAGYEPLAHLCPQSLLSGVDAPAVLLVDDASGAARALRAAGVRPRLVYIDPPFAVERDFHVVERSAREACDSAPPRVAYSDRWPSFDAYVAFMRDVIEAVHDLLADDGSLLLHCDYRSAPELAITCDAVFGRGDRAQRGSAGFRNELVWSYGLGGSSPRCYPKKHDTIYWYSKSERWVFDPPMVPATSARMAGKSKKAPDVLAIPSINNMAAERTGYPTQKPLALLELLVRAHTEPGDLVVDLFSGSGTTAAAALRTGRMACVADAGVEGAGATAARLLRDEFGVSVFGAPDDGCLPRAESALPSGDDVRASVARWCASLGVAMPGQTR